MAKSKNVLVAERLETEVPLSIQKQGFYGFLSWLKSSPDATKLQLQPKVKKVPKKK